MTRSSTLNWHLLGQFPLPVAQLYQAAHNAKNTSDRHSNAYYMWEASLKLLAIRCVIDYCSLPFRDPAAVESLKGLARPGIGSLWGLVRELLPRLAEHDAARFGHLSELLTGGRTVPGLPATATLHYDIGKYFKQATRGRAGDAVSLRDWFDRMAYYRNKTFGHGAIGRWSDPVARAFAGGLLGAGEELHPHVDPLAGGRLVFLEKVTFSSGTAEIDWHDLTGPLPQRKEPLRLKRRDAERLDGKRVYIWANPEGGDARFISAHPFLVYELEENRFWMLNGRQGRRNIELLSYTDGRVDSLGVDPLEAGHRSFSDEERDRFAEDQREFFERLLGTPVGPTDLQAWAQDSLEQEPVQGLIDGRHSGTQLIGDFEVQAELARTLTSVVYRALQPSVAREVALKIHNLQGDVAAEKRFIREVRTLGRVSHPNLARIFVVGLHEHRIYYAMELVRGPDLQRVWRQLKDVGDPDGLTAAQWRTLCQLDEPSPAPAHPPAERTDGAAPAASYLAEPVTSTFLTDWTYYRQVAELLRQTALAVDALHQAGIVHRDIKPGNILLTSQGSRAILVDLGSARDLHEDPAVRATVGPEFVGTPHYASPEQVADARSVDRRTDIYSLGVVLWELLARRQAFEADSIQRVMQLVATKLLDIPRKYEPKVPPELEAIALKCVQRDPDRRYQSAQRLAEDLQRFLDGRPVHAELATTWFRLRRLVSFRKRELMRVALLVTAFVTLSSVSLFLWLREDPMVTLRRQEVGRRVEALTRSEPRPDRAPPHPVHQARRDPVVSYDAFHILEDHRVIDLRGWRPDDSGVTMARRLRLIKTKDADEMIFEGRTSGRDLFMRCSFPNPQTARLIHTGNRKSVAGQEMKARYLAIDVRDIPTQEEFEIRMVSTFWANLKKDEDRWFGVIGYEGSLKISILMLFPGERPFLPPPRLNVAESRNSPLKPYEGPKIVLQDESRRWLYWEVPYPKDNHVYRVDWDW